MLAERGRRSVVAQLAFAECDRIADGVDLIADRDDRFETESRGEGPGRHIVVKPG